VGKEPLRSPPTPARCPCNPCRHDPDDHDPGGGLSGPGCDDRRSDSGPLQWSWARPSDDGAL